MSAVTQKPLEYQRMEEAPKKESLCSRIVSYCWSRKPPDPSTNVDAKPASGKSHPPGLSEKMGGSRPLYPGHRKTTALTNAVWYTTWRLQPTAVPPIPQNVDLVYLFVGALDPNSGVSGLEGPFSDLGKLKTFVQQCKAQGKQVMVSIGGHGGSYDSTWDQLNSGNISTFATALSKFCADTGVAGIDFDWEPDTWTQEQGALVGQLIKSFKAQSPHLQATLCTNSGTAWQTQAAWVFDAAKKEDGSNAIDRQNIMAYYPYSEAEPWLESWDGWIQQYKTSQICVGMLSSAADLEQFATKDCQEKRDASLWYWDPAAPDTSNAATQIVYNAYHPQHKG